MSPPDFQPTLVGPSMSVRPISKDDWTDMFAAGSDPEIWKVHPVPDRHTEAGFRKFFDGAVDSRMGFAFVDRATGRIIGSSRYYGYEPELGEIEIGWTFLASSHGGGGANREVKRLMLDHAFTFVDTVIFWIGDENWRSQGAMIKIGGIKREGLFTRTLSHVAADLILVESTADHRAPCGRTAAPSGAAFDHARRRGVGGQPAGGIWRG
jgi:RimJ/RimL family protein N-acetyltransferase